MAEVATMWANYPVVSSFDLSLSIKQHVARTFSPWVAELNQRSRMRTVTLRRQMAMYLRKQLADASNGDWEPLWRRAPFRFGALQRHNPPAEAHRSSGKPRDQHAPKVFRSGFSILQNVKMTVFIGRSPAINHGEQRSRINVEFRAQFIEVGISSVTIRGAMG
jgi:hypothetical protein